MRGPWSTLHQTACQGKTPLGREDLSPVENPLLQLQRLASETLRLKDILGDAVEAMSSWTHEDVVGREDFRAVLRAYERALDRAQKVLSGMVRLDLDERLAKLSAAQAAILIKLFEAVILEKDMALTMEQVQIAKAIIAARFLGSLPSPPRS